jgi:hypothetical protein
MRFILFVFIASLLMCSCDSVGDSVINTSVSKTNLLDLSAPVNLIRIQNDVEYRVVARFDNSVSIDKVWFNLISDDGTISITQNQLMTDDGDPLNGDNTANDNRFSGLILLTDEVPSTLYSLEVYTQLVDGLIQKSGFSKLNYDSGQENVAPVLSNLVFPDSIKKAEFFTFTVNVTDENGLVDVKDVYFDFYRPDGTYRGRVSMVDNGNSSAGDTQANDGIYSFRNRFDDNPPDTVQIGTYRFEFEAIDRRNELSNKIIQNIAVSK